MDLLSMDISRVTGVLTREFGKGRYHAEALYREVFKSGNQDWIEAKEFLHSPALSQKLKNRFHISPGDIIQVFQDGELKKFITRLKDGKKIESVIIPMARHNTLCISSQVGCKMACRFCETGKMGFVRHLSVSEIIGQLFNARFRLQENIKNVVFMGMGEPLDNFDNVLAAIHIMKEQKGFNIALRHITVSTAGLPEKIRQLGGMGLSGLRLAISINAANDSTRSFLMPVNKRFNLETLKQTLLNFPLPRRGCFLFEYILIKSLNDSIKDAIELAKFIDPLPVRLNLIPCNPVDGFNFQSPGDDEMNKFAEVLTRKGVFVIKRWSKGRSVSAGCGQLGQDCRDAVSGIKI